MRYIFVILLSLPLLSVNLNAEYEMHIPNCTQKGVENCGGFLFDNETGDVLFCGSESCIDLKLPKSWKAKQKDKLSKQDQILEMLSNIQVGSVNTVQNVEPSSDTKIVNQEVKSEEKKVGKGGWISFDYVIMNEKEQIVRITEACVEKILYSCKN